MTTLRAATRGSALARWQTDHVAALLADALDPAAGAPDDDADGRVTAIEPVVIETTADKRLDIPIWEMGGKGVFVKEVQAAVLDGRARIAVHSGKDLPAQTHPELVVAAVPHRADPRDVLVGATFADLPTGATIATGSVRRRAQLAWRRPDLTFTGLRGNIATRLQRIPAGGAIVMAAAALDRLGLHDALAAQGLPFEVLDPLVMLPQVAQGALAVECRRDDDEARALLSRIEHAPSRRAFDAERAFLDALGGDCDLPAGAHAITIDPVTPDAPVVTKIEAVLASLDGHTVLRHRLQDPDPERAGRRVAEELLDAGGRSLLDR